MSTSFLEGRLLGGATGSRDYRLVSTDPVGACITRDFAVNNLLHFADEFAQVRVAWAGTLPGYLKGGGGDGYLQGPTTPTANYWYSIVNFGPFPIPLRQDGSSYKMRVRIAGASSAGHAVSFRLVVAPVRFATTYLHTGDDVAYETASTTSTTAAWLLGSSKGSAMDTQVAISSTLVSQWMASTSTLASIGGNPTSVDQCLVSCCVFGKSVSVSSTPRLYGLYAAEWVG